MKQEKDDMPYPITAGLILSLGFSLVASALIGLYLGSLLDRTAQNKVFTPIGLLLGLAAGFHRAWILIRSITKKKRKK